MSPDDLASASDLYEADFYAWTQSQAAKLRAQGPSHAAGLDWQRLAEEIEDVGKSEYRTAASFVALIIEHFYKLAWTRREEPKPGWRAEIAVFRIKAADALTASIRRKIFDDLDRLHRLGAKQAMVAFLSVEPAAPRDESLRWSLEQILGERDDPIGDAA
jgi:hypothetical protein